MHVYLFLYVLRLQFVLHFAHSHVLVVYIYVERMSAVEEKIEGNVLFFI